ncbi:MULTISPECIES: RagB/SusD family nutrient uptake outer membrane protein [Sphingobacterium]|uniref:RagB/SusD family nutrient uptake outer membrane protein n=1 Tax=Sphingobacterium TaxID=28453 RepID=UPI0011F31257|nr:MULTISPECIES: RagB/SusD family nutrient uptake outer membrane protein [Sphingobacterium]
MKIEILKNTWKYLFMFFTCLSTISCDFDVLDTVPSDRYSEDAIWDDPALIETYVSSTYRSLPNGFRYSFYNLSVMVDELNARNNSWLYAYWGGNLTADNLGIANYWSSVPTGTNTNQNYWTTINRTNIFFQNIERERSKEMVQETKDRMLGEMKVMRAKCYFELISLFGGVPLITKPFKLNDDFKLKRNTYDEIMSFLLKEIEEAIELLPLDYDAANKGRITKGAAMALKSRALLYRASPLNNTKNDRSMWEAAANAAKDVIDLKKYSLFRDYRTYFLEENIYNSEAIWQRPFNQLISPEAVYLELASYPNGYNGFGQIHPLQNLVDDFETIRGLLPENDPLFNDQDPYKDRDPRFYATILHDGMMWKGREVETFLPGGKDSNEGSVSPWNASETGYYPRKFVNERINNPSSTNMSQTPWTFFRYAEILLNYAEANYFLGNEAVAREYLNFVRARESVNMPAIPSNVTGKALFDRIVNERRVELVFEMHRWYDVRRWKIAPEVLNTDFLRMDIRRDPTTGKKTYKKVVWKKAVFTDKDYLLPVPQDELDKNELLTQNPGYN